MEPPIVARHSIAERIRDSLPPLDPSRLDAERRALFERLPDDLRALLLEHNGGFVDANEFTFATNCPAGHDGLQELYGFGADALPDHVSVPHDFANYATLSRVAGSFAEFAASTFEPDMDAWLADHQPQVVKPKGLRRLFRRR